MGLKDSWKFFYIVTVPFLLIWIPFMFYDSKTASTSKEGNLLYVIALIVAAWMTNALTSVPAGLLSICMLPLLGIQAAGPVANNCMTEQGMLLLGQAMIGCSFIVNNLHKRLSLKILSWSGHCPVRLLTAIYFNTLIHSILVSSPAATILMCAVAIDCIEELMSMADDTQRLITDEEDTKKNTAEVEPDRNEATTKSDANAGEPKSDIPQADDKSSLQNPSGESQAENKGSIGEGETQAEDALKDAGLEDDLEYKAAMMDVPKESELPPESEPVELDRQRILKELKKRYLIAVYIAANIGGLILPYTSSMVNILYEFADPLKEILQPPMATTLLQLPLLFASGGKHVHLGIHYHFFFALPIVLFLGIFGYFYLAFVFVKVASPLTKGTPGPKLRLNVFGKRPQEEEMILEKQKAYYEDRVRALGGYAVSQTLVTVILILLIALCLTRDPRFIFAGWSSYISKDKGNHSIRIGDSAATIMLVVFMFAVPKFTCKRTDTKPAALLSWKFLESVVPWNVALTMGFQFILSSALHVTDLEAVALNFFNKSKMSLAILPLPCIAVAIFVSEMWGGFATTNFITPIFAFMSHRYSTYGPLALSVAVASSLSFMFPVATPTNLMVFWTASGDLTILDMIKYGAVMDIVSFIAVAGAHYGIGPLLF